MKDKHKWYKLDTSAKIYPALESIHNPSIFRLSAVLKEVVNPTILLEALENISERFPYYNVRMKKGLFWSYLEHNDAKHIIWKETQSPCNRIHPVFNNGYLYKVRYFNKRIGVDMFHVLTDGYGASEFLKCLVAEYLHVKGDVKNIDTKYVMDKNFSPQKEECEDAFLKVLDIEKDNLPEEKKRTLFAKSSAFKPKGRHMSIGKYKVVTGLVSVEELKTLSKKYNATITQLLASIYLEAMLHLQTKQVKNKKKHKPLSIQIPVNMRKLYPINCMRNFALFVIPYVDPRDIKSLEDIISAVKSYMNQYVSKEHLLTMVEDNCSLATNFYIRHVPLGLKNIVIRFINNTTGSTQFSGTLSNLGILTLQEDMKDAIDYFDFILGPSGYDKNSFSMISFGDTAAISFGKTVKSGFIPEYVFTKLIKLGVKVEIKSNY